MLPLCLVSPQFVCQVLPKTYEHLLAPRDLRLLSVIYVLMQLECAFVLDGFNNNQWLHCSMLGLYD